MKLLKEKSLTVLLIISTILAISYTYIFLFVNKTALGAPDALARLNISRRIIDNITPGIAQLGGVWLPLPQLFYVPLVQVEFLYRTALAGAIVNGAAFILGTFFVFRTVELMTKNRIAAFIAGIAYSLSSNLLFFQSSAMSETTTITFLLGSTYYLLKWTYSNKLPDLFLCALYIILITLTRYEGFMVLALAAICVFTIALFKYKKIKKVEGLTILFITSASFGFLLWTLYLTLIFKDPLYWYHVYSHQISIISSETLVVSDVASSVTREPFSLNKLIRAVNVMKNFSIDMSGLIYVVLGIFGALWAIASTIKNKTINNVALVIMLGPALFLFMNLVKDPTTMIVPDFDWDAMFDKGFHIRSEFNSRYGLQFLPIFVIFLGYLAHKLRFFSLIVLILVLVQFCSVFSDVNLIFALQKRPAGLYNKYKGPIDWLNENHREGKILSSVLANDAMMFHLNMPYKTFIFEGNGKYWLESLDDPTKYATYVMFKNLPKIDKVEAFSDRVAFHLQDKPMLLNNYDLVYKGEMLIYKIKDKPKYEIK